jgi:hypothetical protein
MQNEYLQYDIESSFTIFHTEAKVGTGLYDWMVCALPFLQTS